MAKKETKKKEKDAKKEQEKAKKKKGSPQSPKSPQTPPPVDPSQLTPEQLTQVQIEEAIKESQDPSSKLRKLRSPLSVRSCLISLLILVVLTVGIVLLCCYIFLDKETFNLGVVIKDMLNKFPTERHSIMWFIGKVAEKFKSIFHIS